ncbi:MAG: PaaI family thioesterase [Halioglobus sp.]|nr:PaaI family thioesterase [Halioglobus sp.]
MQEQDSIDALNERAPHFIALLGGRVIGVDSEARTCTFEFNVVEDFCHSVDVVQGGFVTAMLDAAMSHAMFAHDEFGGLAGVSSLEIKTSFLEPTRAGRLLAIGRILKSTYKTAFMEALLYNEDGELTATASTVAKLPRQG